MNTKTVDKRGRRSKALLPLVAILATSAWATTLTSGVARASTITTGEISTRVSDHVGIDADGEPDGTASSNCIRYSPTDTSSSSDWVDAMSTPNEARTAHGREEGSCPSDLEIEEQSAVGIRPAAGGSVADGSRFLLGRVVHYNNPIIGSADYFKGLFSVRMDGFDGDPVVNFDWWMWETPNNADPCPGGDDENGCFDEIKFSSKFSDKLMTQGGVDYRLLIDGFFPVAAGAACPATPTGATNDVFWTAERATSHACLYATLGQVRTVTVVKDINGVTDEITAPSTEFDFTTTGTLKGSPWDDDSFSLTPPANGMASSKAVEIARGDTVTIDEGPAPSAKWELTAVSCVDFDANGDPRPLPSATYDLEDGVITLTNVPAPANIEKPDITCTFTNTYTPLATLTLKKTVSSGEATAADFTLTATGESSAPASGRVVTGVSGSDAVTSVVVPAGEYQLSETGPGSYISDNGWSCDGSEESANVVLLSDGDSTTCTISNRYAEGVLNIAVVVSDPSNGLTNSTKVFAGTYVCGDAAPVAFTATVAAPFVVSDLPKGTSCTATETQPTGDLLNANYSWGTPTYSTRPVTIGDGTVATLTITNPIGFVAPTTTTAAPAPTTTVVVTGLGGPATTTSLPVSTVAPSALPTTGSGNTTSLVALAVALMVIGVALGRRRQWSDEV